jgi:tRNA-dihydrouridine synthase
MTFAPSKLLQKLTEPLTIGNVTLKSRVLQSPLSGVTDLVFRRLVRRYATDSMLYTEMISATDLHHMKALPKLMEIDRHETPISIQLWLNRCFGEVKKGESPTKRLAKLYPFS